MVLVFTNVAIALVLFPVPDNILTIIQFVVYGRVVVVIITFGILLGLLVYTTAVVIDAAFILKHRNTPLLH